MKTAETFADEFDNGNYDNIIELIRAIQQDAAVPDGMVLVPRECPEEVIREIDLPIETNFNQSEAERIAVLYRDMIAAAQKEG